MCNGYEEAVAEREKAFDWHLYTQSIANPSTNQDDRKKSTLNVRSEELKPIDSSKLETRGVRHGETISHKLFTLALADIFKCLWWDQKGVRIDGGRINPLRLADAITLFSSAPHELAIILQELKDASQGVGLKMNLQNIQLMSPETVNASVGNPDLGVVKEYIYLGHNGSSLERKIGHQRSPEESISPGWHLEFLK
uniref:Reverse transcriptase domain-containing protein n=1 Tax=Dendroctonus ponderosae TaxID=77166 RepID=A0AAR5PR67_DENPD